MPSVEESLCRGLFTVPYTVFTRWQASRIAGIQPYSVIVYEYIPEYNCFDFFFFHAIRRNLIQFLFLKRSKKAFHSRIVITMSGAAQTLHYSAAF